MTTLLLLYLAYAIVLNIALARHGLPSRSPQPPVVLPTASRVLVIGATGGTGRQLVLQALERQFLVTAFVRNPARFDIAHPRLTIVKGDVLDHDAVARAMTGQDAVVSALGHRRYFYPTRILSVGTRNVLRAMEANGVSRFVCETSLGIGASAGRMGVYYTLFVIPVILPFYFWDKTRQERLIADSRTVWTIVRPVVLTNAAARGTCRHGDDVGGWLATHRVPRADVARFMLDQLSDNRHVSMAVGVS
jgi:putative NADH-flavin reductase